MFDLKVSPHDPSVRYSNLPQPTLGPVPKLPISTLTPLFSPLIVRHPLWTKRTRAGTGPTGGGGTAAQRCRCGGFTVKTHLNRSVEWTSTCDPRLALPQPLSLISLFYNRKTSTCLSTPSVTPTPRLQVHLFLSTESQKINCSLLVVIIHKTPSTCSTPRANVLSVSVVLSLVLIGMIRS